MHVNEDGEVSFCQLSLSSKGLEVTFSLTIKQDFSWVLTYRGDFVEPTICKVLQALPSCANSGNFVHVWLAMIILM